MRRGLAWLPAVGGAMALLMTAGCSGSKNGIINGNKADAFIKNCARGYCDAAPPEAPVPDMGPPDMSAPDTKPSVDMTPPDAPPPTYSLTATLFQANIQGSTPALQTLIAHVSVNASKGEPTPDVDTTGGTPFGCTAYHFNGSTKLPLFLTGDAGNVVFNNWTGATPHSVTCTFGSSLAGYDCTGGTGMNPLAPVATPFIKAADQVETNVAGGTDFSAVTMAEFDTTGTAPPSGGPVPQIAMPEESSFTVSTNLNGLVLSTVPSTGLPITFSCASGSSTCSPSGSDPGVNIVVVAMETTDQTPSMTNPFPSPTATSKFGEATCIFPYAGGTSGKVTVPQSVTNDIIDSGYTVVRTIVVGAAGPATILNSKGQFAENGIAFGDLGISPRM